jgi:hypothetical protein
MGWDVGKLYAAQRLSSTRRGSQRRELISRGAESQRPGVAALGRSTH